jgi:hypothetical protein
MKPIELSSLPPHDIMNPIETKSHGFRLFLKLPLEIRYLIYLMLLTTPYCTQIASTGKGLEFKLHTAILLVNKQIAEEGTRIMYHGNDFIVLSVTGINMHLNRIPKFRLLSEDRIPRPVLRITLAVATDNLVDVGEERTLITTSEGLQPIINAIWGLEYYRLAIPMTGNPNILFVPRKIHHGEMSLTLDFYLKAEPRYKALNTLLIKPWEMINGLASLILTGDIDEQMCERLRKYNSDGPFPNEVATRLTEYHCMAKRRFEQKDYVAVQWYGTVIDDYMTYLFLLKPHRLKGAVICEPGTELWQVLKKSFTMYHEGRLDLVIASLRQFKYTDATKYADDVLEEDFGRGLGRWYYREDNLAPIMQKKFTVCLYLARYALQNMIDLEFARFVLYTSLDDDIDCTDLVEALQDKAPDCVIVWRNSIWTLAVRGPVIIIRDDIMRPVPVDSRGWYSLWEWLELPEEPELPEESDT